jgi:hypothetical protein
VLNEDEDSEDQMDGLMLKESDEILSDAGIGEGSGGLRVEGVRDGGDISDESLDDDHEPHVEGKKKSGSQDGTTVDVPPPSQGKRKRPVGDSGQEKLIPSYRTRSKHRASMNAKKRLLRSMVKRN